MWQPCLNVQFYNAVLTFSIFFCVMSNDISFESLYYSLFMILKKPDVVVLHNVLKKKRVSKFIYLFMGFWGGGGVFFFILFNLVLTKLLDAFYRF